MKTRLLRLLRKRASLEYRNGKVRVSGIGFGWFTPPQFSKCLSFGSNIKLCREFIAWDILNNARALYTKPKKTVRK